MLIKSIKLNLKLLPHPKTLKFMDFDNSAFCEDIVSF